MTQAAELLAYSRGPHSKPLATFRLRYPRFIHAEVMTHRMFSRNASSSRAVPIPKLIADIRRDPAMPLHWGKNQPGMQAHEELTGAALDAAKRAWSLARDEAVVGAVRLMNAGAHKQLVNRVLEPFSHINVIITATEWANFFALRCHPDAQPEIRDLAEKMKKLLDENEPKLLHPGEWHLPLVDPEEYGDTDIETAELLKVSVARCARVSYYTFDGKRSTVEDDVALYEKLLVSQPLHASPAEHQATPDTKSHYERSLVEFSEDDSKEELLESGEDWDNPELRGNFAPGWIQFRKTIPGECTPG